MGRAGRLTWRNRAVSAGAVALGLVLCRLLWDDAFARADAVYRFTAAVGYGHLLGAAWPPASGGRSGFFDGLERTALAAVACLAGLAVYAHLLALAPWVVGVVLAGSIWHTVENDAALRTAYGGDGRLGPLGRTPARRARVWIVSAALMAIAVATPEGPAFVEALAPFSFGGASSPRGVDPAAGLVPLGLADVFAAVTLYHLVSWLVLVRDRARALRRRGRRRGACALRRRLVLVHAGPAALVAAGWWLHPDPASGWPGLLLSPAVYLYWSALHVVQTAVRRGRTCGGSTAVEPAASGPG